MKWEYKIVRFLPKQITFPTEKLLVQMEDMLNELGKMGWEVIAMESNQWVVILKRPVQQPIAGSKKKSDNIDQTQTFRF